MIFGYARISTNKETQKTDRQVLALNEYAEHNNFKIDEIVEEKISGTVNADNRPKYSELKTRLRKGDVLLITDVDRLGRDAKDVIAEFQTLKSSGKRVIALDTPYLNEWENLKDDSMYDMIADIFITLKAHMAQQEREKIKSRINQGLDVARANGKTLGRPQLGLPKSFNKYYKQMLDKQISKVEMAKLLGVSRKHLYTMLKKHEENKEC